MKVIHAVGARPNLIKVAPILKEMKKYPAQFESVLVHTGQHYDYGMPKVFFQDLELPAPDMYLGVGSGTHAEQSGRVMIEFEKILLRGKPDLVIVVGDVNSTLAAALAAAKLHIPIGHVEAGLRSYDREMPEEINRVLTDHISTFLFCPTEIAVRKLQKEGFTNVVNNGKLIPDHASLIVHYSSLTTSHAPLVINAGDVMYESALDNLEIAKRRSKILRILDLKPKNYILATVHRAENTDNLERLKEIFDSFVELSKNGEKLIVPLHPRTEKALAQISVNSINYLRNNGLKVMKPGSYLDMLILESNAKLIMTDSGGVQKEAYFFKVPCVTLRDETEWVETVESKWNALGGGERRRILEAVERQLLNSSRDWKSFYGNGKTAEKIVRDTIQLGKKYTRRI